MPNESLVNLGFVRVDCAACKNPDVWFKCDQCGKSDHFLLTDDRATCTCGAIYQSGNCTCGESVPFEGLVFVPFEQGPMALADMEVAWGRVIGLVVVVALLIGAVAMYFLGQ